MVSQSQVLEPAAAFRPGVQLPARVVRALQAERERGEILTSWVQAGVLCVFATLYFLAPSTSPVHILMRPVPSQEQKTIPHDEPPQASPLAG